MGRITPTQSKYGLELDDVECADVCPDVLDLLASHADEVGTCRPQVTVTRDKDDVSTEARVEKVLSKLIDDGPERGPGRERKHEDSKVGGLVELLLVLIVMGTVDIVDCYVEQHAAVKQGSRKIVAERRVLNALYLTCPGRKLTNQLAASAVAFSNNCTRVMVGSNIHLSR